MPPTAVVAAAVAAVVAAKAETPAAAEKCARRPAELQPVAVALGREAAFFPNAASTGTAGPDQRHF